MTQHDHRRVIAIDGPAAAGKSTVAQGVASDVDAMLFDTGALYRSVTLLALRHQVPLGDDGGLSALVVAHNIVISPPSVSDGRQVDARIDGEDVTWALRSPEIDANVSEVSAHAGVREALLGVQREIADGARVVMVGRDIGTAVIPDAGVKIYLDASAGERARRRLVELQGRGEQVDYDEVLAAMIERDRIDSTREVAPLRAAGDAHRVPTDGKSIDEVIAIIAGIVRNSWQEMGVDA